MKNKKLPSGAYFLIQFIDLLNQNTTRFPIKFCKLKIINKNLKINVNMFKRKGIAKFHFKSPSSLVHLLIH